MTVRIATYNLFEGAGGSYNRLVEFVRGAQLDVVCFQEVNGWQDGDNARLKDFTDKVLFAASAFGNSNTEFKLATISKHAITGKTLHAEAFWHAALETQLQLGGKPVTVVNLHLDPWQEASREKEVGRLLAALKPGAPTIITGDFNSLSRQDNYPPELLTQLQAKGISKYGANALEFRVVDRLLQAGFVDAAAAAGNFATTVPSAYNTDKDHEVPVRVDYMFVSPDLVPFIRGYEVVKNDLTDAISDHYPVILTLDMDGTPAPARQMAETPAPLSVPAPPPAPAPAPIILDLPQHVTPWQPPEDGTPPPPTPAPAPLPEPPHGPVKPWVPEPDPDAPKASEPTPPQPKDGEVTMWLHRDDAAN
ncbi:MAG TPA: endonuclease/exonuclease/phosphatase family protein [Candidatus Saccharimonadales bacterium]|nr:endonuclease/exonuclease/phosphatase family protein [Candidatus Saccharimonadales bacterium]